MTGAFPLGRQQVFSIVDSRYRVNVWEGSVRSGKTIASIIRWLAFLENAPAGGRLVMIGRTRDSLFRNVIQPMQDPDLFGPIADEVKYTPGAPTAVIRGKTIHVMGASDVSAEKVVRGLTLSGAYCDEITVLQASFFKQLLARMSVPGAQLFGTTNPDSPYHWFKTEYLDRIDDLNVSVPDDGLTGNWASWHFTLDDNPGLGESYKNAIKAEYTGLWYKRFILGQWVSAEGAVYDMWDDDKHVVPWNELPRIVEYLAVGVDYGTTNPTSAIIAGIGDDGVIYLVDEWRYAPSSRTARLTDVELSRQIRAWLNETHHPTGPTSHPPPLVVDPSAASFHVQLHQDGTGTYPAENDVLYGIRTVSTLLAAGRLKVSDRCTGFIAEAPGYAWDQKATDEGRDAVIKANDHCLVGDTVVTTVNGGVRIADVAPGDVVATRNGWRRVVDAWMVSPSAEVMRIRTVGGRTLTGTPNHRVWTANRGWVRMDQLSGEDTLRALDATSPHNPPRFVDDGVVSVTTGLPREPVYDLTVEGDHEFIAGGILVHNSLDAARYALITTERRWRQFIPNL